MSTLTKILIVLLSLFTIFLSGAIVTYVSSANNYKAMYDEQKSLNDSISAEIASVKQLYNEKVAQMKLLEDDLNRRIRVLDGEKVELLVDLRTAERESLGHEGKVDSLTGALTSFQTTIGNMEKSLKLTQAQLDVTRSENIVDRQKLNEATASLVEKIVQLQALETERRRLLEQKTMLQGKLSHVLGTSGEEFRPVVTREQGPQRASQGAAVSSDLNGLISDVGSSMVTISLGSADGVTKGMLFHTIRGSDFICDVIITDVDVNQSVGVPELVQQQPRIGDNISTKL